MSEEASYWSYFIPRGGAAAQLAPCLHATRLMYCHLGVKVYKCLYLNRKGKKSSEYTCSLSHSRPLLERLKWWFITHWASPYFSIQDSWHLGCTQRWGYSCTFEHTRLNIDHVTLVHSLSLSDVWYWCNLRQDLRRTVTLRCLFVLAALFYVLFLRNRWAPEA